MKALQLRSPINVSYFNSGGGFSSLELSIYVNRDVTDIDTTTVPDYSLVSEPINQRVNFEIAELIRSKNDYLYDDDFYTARDTATYVLLRAVLLDSDGDEIETKYNFFKVRDGYVERNEVQLLDSEINPDPRTWSNNVNATISDNRDDPFGGTDAYFIEDTSDPSAFVLDEVLQLTGVHTLSVFLKGSNTIQIGADPSNVIIFNLVSGKIVGTNGDIIAYDIFKVGEWFKISIVQNMSLNDGLRIREEVPAGAAAIRLFNPTIIKGNLLNFTPTQVLLQSNTQVFSHSSIRPLYMLDRKESVAYDLNSSLNSEIDPDPRTWSTQFNTTIAADGDDPFGGTDAYSISDTNDVDPFVLRDILQLTGIHTLSCFVLGDKPIQIGKDSDNYIIINPSTGIITGVVGDVLSYDILRVGGWFKISIVQNMSLNDGLKIRDQIPTGPGAIRLFNPTIIKGNLVNFTPFFIANPLVNSAIVSITRREFFLINQTLTIPEKILCEPKYTPVKVSFINKFGVIQDLVFFKKREDSFNTTQQDFKANILRNGTYLPHTGQKQIINKQASAKLKLSTGFYPEEFNEVFKQLQYSINYWIDDEPAILTGSNFAFKTSVNDKLINYSFDFEYANPDINDIR
jgi:hypothetical protein